MSDSQAERVVGNVVSAHPHALSVVKARRDPMESGSELILLSSSASVLSLVSLPISSGSDSMRFDASTRRVMFPQFPISLGMRWILLFVASTLRSFSANSPSASNNLSGNSRKLESRNATIPVALHALSLDSVFVFAGARRGADGAHPIVASASEASRERSVSESDE